MAKAAALVSLVGIACSGAPHQGPPSPAPLGGSFLRTELVPPAGGALDSTARISVTASYRIAHFDTTASLYRLSIQVTASFGALNARGCQPIVLTVPEGTLTAYCDLSDLVRRPELPSPWEVQFWITSTAKPTPAAAGGRFGVAPVTIVARAAPATYSMYHRR
jgi:hypothetical protein